MRVLVGHGSMYLRRDNCLIFHGCVPTDAAGNFNPLSIDGQLLAGRAMFEKIEEVVRRAAVNSNQADLTFCGICGVVRIRLCSAKTESPPWNATLSPTSLLTMRKRTATFR